MYLFINLCEKRSARKVQLAKNTGWDHVVIRKYVYHTPG